MTDGSVPASTPKIRCILWACSFAVIVFLSFTAGYMVALSRTAAPSGTRVKDTLEPAKPLVSTGGEQTERPRGETSKRPSTHSDKAPKAPPKVNIDFDLTNYRRLANLADGVLVGTIGATKESKRELPPRTVTELEVLTVFADGKKGIVMLRHNRKQLAELLKHKGEEHLFFWHTIAPGPGYRARGMLAFFPFDEKHKKVLKWLQGGARQHTFFDPSAKTILPAGLELSTRLGHEGLRSFLVIRLTNRRKEAIVLARNYQESYPPHTGNRLIRADGAVVWPGWQELTSGEGPFVAKYVTVKPGESFEMAAFSFVIPDQKTWLGPPHARFLTPGLYHFRFVYDSQGCRASKGKRPLKARMVIYGNFEAKPREVIWSKSVTSKELGLQYRLGVFDKTVSIVPAGFSRFPVVVEVRNIGRKPVRLYAGGSLASGLVCDFYADGERVGFCPMVAKLVEGHVELRLGGVLRTNLDGIWRVNTPGTKQVSVGFRVVISKQPRSFAQTKAMKTPSIPVLFKSAKKKAEKKPK